MNPITFRQSIPDQWDAHNPNRIAVLTAGGLHRRAQGFKLYA
ncbi:hypothetical protein SynBIOSE41_01394 [Synechococcus sp. BIOS-E4-1]|nr:hypothetical protein SynBIOSE41_01394 [Synechococcus sp. BIOS-E4-1]